MKARRFTRQQRLLQAIEFSRVFDKPDRRSDKFFTILYISNNSGIGRLGMAISKKRARRAVDRNRIKRLVRETFRHHQQELTGLDIVVLARDPAASTNNPVLQKSLKNHWQQLQK